MTVPRGSVSIAIFARRPSSGETVAVERATDYA